MKWSLLLLLFLIPSLAFGAENCSMFSGKCKDSCTENELAEQGAFLDCTEKQECCVPKKEPKKNAAPSLMVPVEKETIIEKNRTE